MSFALTTEQVRNRTKTVTRRLGWRFAKAGDVVQPVVKSQGLKKGETVEKIGGPIRVVSVRREPLERMAKDRHYGAREARAEGFEAMNGAGFVQMFCEHNNVTPEAEVTRIEFEYVDQETDAETRG